MRSPRGVATVVILLAASSLLAQTPRETSAPVESQHFGKLRIVLDVADVRRSVEFFRDVVGFQLVHFVVGDAKLVETLKPTDRPYAAALLIGDEEIGLSATGSETNAPATGARYHFTVDDPDALLSRLRARETRIGHLVPSSGGGTFMFSFSDPDGHLFFVHASPKKP
jgi:catechol 2,3-dioxygenase-like lactoylglutathione lyase family enzyme